MPIIKAMHLQIEIKLPFKAGLGVAESQNVVHMQYNKNLYVVHVVHANVVHVVQK